MVTGKQLKILREKAKLSRKDLALKLGITTNYSQRMCNIENGHTTLSPKKMQEWATICGATIDTYIVQHND